MDPLAITVEIFVVAISTAIFGGMVALIALDALADKQALESTSSKQSPISATVQQIQAGTAQPASNTASIPKAA